MKSYKNCHSLMVKDAMDNTVICPTWMPPSSPFLRNIHLLLKLQDTGWNTNLNIVIIVYCCFIFKCATFLEDSTGRLKKRSLSSQLFLDKYNMQWRTCCKMIILWSFLLVDEDYEDIFFFMYVCVYTCEIYYLCLYP